MGIVELVSLYVTNTYPAPYPQLELLTAFLMVFFLVEELLQYIASYVIILKITRKLSIFEKSQY